MRIITEKLPKDCIHISEVNSGYYIVAKTENDYAAFITTDKFLGKPVFKSLAGITVGNGLSRKCGDLYGNKPFDSIKELIEHFKEFEFHAFKTWKEAFQWLINNTN